MIFPLFFPKKKTLFVAVFCKRILFFGSLSLLTGCFVSLPKDQQVENLLPPPSLEASVDASLDTPFFSIGQWPQRYWWEAFNSPQLNALIADALAYNPTLKEVESRVAFAEEMAMIARARLFPWIFFKGQDDWQYLSQNGLYRALNPNIPLSANLVNLNFALRYEFDFWGKYRNLFIAALGETRASEAEAAQVALTLSTAVAQAYFALKTDLQRKRLYEALYEVRYNSFQLANLLQKKALSSRLEPLFSEESVLEAKKLVLCVENEIAADRHWLNILVGAGPDEPLEINEILPPLPETLALPSDLSIGLLVRRPDLMAQIWHIEALAHEVGAAIADFFPDVNLTAFVGLESTAYSLLFKSSSFGSGVKPALSLPLFTAGAISANVGAKKAEFDEAVFAYNNLILTSAKEVADLLTLAQVIFQQKIEQEGVVKSARSRYELTVLRQQKGLDSFFQNYAIQAELIQKELDDVELLYDEYGAAIQLIKALGGGYNSDYLPLEAEECQ